MIATVMQRYILLPLLCISLVSLGVPGFHAHVSKAWHGVSDVAVHDALAHELQPVFDAHHGDANHVHHVVDLDLQSKAVGKGQSLNWLAGCLIVAAALLLDGAAATAMPVSPRRRPAKARSSSHVLPPSHAPPYAA